MGSKEVDIEKFGSFLRANSQGEEDVQTESVSCQVTVMLEPLSVIEYPPVTI
jgi:hypothetical protein